MLESNFMLNFIIPITSSYTVQKDKKKEYTYNRSNIWNETCITLKCIRQTLKIKENSLIHNGLHLAEQQCEDVYIQFEQNPHAYTFWNYKSMASLSFICVSRKYKHCKKYTHTNL